MTITVYVPCDSAALSVGADDVAAAIHEQADMRGLDIQIIRNGSRGMCWLEPLVEVLHDGVRYAYGPVTGADVPGLFDAGFLQAGRHDLALGPTDALDWLANQERLTFARVGVICQTGRSISVVMRMKGIPAPSQTECLWKVIHSACWRAWRSRASRSGHRKAMSTSDQNIRMPSRR